MLYIKRIFSPHRLSPVSIVPAVLSAAFLLGVPTAFAETDPVAVEDITDEGYKAYVAAEAEKANLPPDAHLMIVGDVDSFWGPGNAEETGAATFRIIDVENQPFDRAARVDLAKVQPMPWDAMIKTPSINAPIRAGDVVYGVFYVRADADDESATGTYRSYLQQDIEDNWDSISESGGNPGGAWSRRVFKARAKKNFDPGVVNYAFQMGTKVQALEVGGFAAWNLGHDADMDALPVSRVSYIGQDPDAAWRAPAWERIDQHRKANLTVRVVDADGQPVENAEVRVHLDNHKFGFGTWAGAFGSLLDDNEDGQNLRRIMTTYYNRLSTPIYPAESWGWPNPEIRERYLRYMKWTTDTGFPVRAHVLLWSAWERLPQQFYDLREDPQALNEAVLAYIDDVMHTIKAFPLAEIDVQNETRNNHILEDHVGGEEARIAWWKRAAEIAPGIRQAVNEYGIVSDRGLNAFNHQTYEEDIQLLLDAGVPVEVIGMQCHIGEDFTDIERVYEVFDRFAKFGLPIHVTEFDVATLDEQTKADYLRDFYTIAFSHPAVEAVIQWGFWEKEMWKPQAGLWAPDWTPKPAGKAYMQLMTETFHTDLSTATDAAGTTTSRGFKGDYTVTVTHDGQTVSTKATLDGDTAITLTLD